MSTLQARPDLVADEGQCVVCNAPVEVTMRRDGGIAVVDATDYSGLTDNGDEFVCRDHYCPVCGGYHLNADAFDRCAHYGAPGVDMTPPCSVEIADAVLRANGMRA